MISDLFLTKARSVFACFDCLNQMCYTLFGTLPLLLYLLGFHEVTKVKKEVCIVKSLNLLANAVIAGVLVHYICLITDAGFTYLLQIIF